MRVEYLYNLFRHINPAATYPFTPDIHRYINKSLKQKLMKEDVRKIRKRPYGQNVV